MAQILDKAEGLDLAPFVAKVLEELKTINQRMRHVVLTAAIELNAWNYPALKQEGKNGSHGS